MSEHPGADRLIALAELLESTDSEQSVLARESKPVARLGGRLRTDDELAASLREQAAGLRSRDYSAGVGLRGTKPKPKRGKR